MCVEVGNICGQLSEVRADDMAAHVIARLIDRRPSLDHRNTDVILGVPTRLATTTATWRAWQRCSRDFPSVSGRDREPSVRVGMSAVVNAARAVARRRRLYVAGSAET